MRNAANGAVNISREKPDFTAPNGINTTVNLGTKDIEGDNFTNFFGTSVAAPTLLMEAHQKFEGSSLAPEAVQNLLRASAWIWELRATTMQLVLGLLGQTLSSLLLPPPLLLPSA